jgi:hypothetical protein
MGTASGAVLATGTGHPPPDDNAGVTEVLAPLQAQIHRAFVEDPYHHLNWGTATLPAACAAIGDRILATGPHGNDDTPRRAMDTAGCGDLADFNADPTASRMFGAVLTLAASAATVALVAWLAITVVLAQILAVILFALAPFAAVAAILPGGGREIAWRWLAALLRVGLAVVGMSLVLSLLLLTIRALLEGSEGLGLTERFALIDVAVLAAFIARRRILGAGHHLAATVGQRLATRRPGGDRATPWMAAPAIAGATGFALGASLGPDRTSRTSRLAGTAGRNRMANRRLHKQQKAADRRMEGRANQVAVRERTEIVADSEGHPHSRRVMTVDGPAARSRRARDARELLEARHATRFAQAQHARASSENGLPPNGHRKPQPPLVNHHSGNGGAPPAANPKPQPGLQPAHKNIRWPSASAGGDHSDVGGEVVVDVEEP